MTFKKILRIFVATVISVTLFSMLSINAFAKGSADFNVPKTTVDKGKIFSVTIKFSADDSIGFVNGMLSYDDNILDFEPSDFVSGGGGLLTINAFPNSPSSDMSLTVKFKGKTSGRTKLDLTNCYMTSDDGTQIGSPSAYGYVTVSGNNASTDETDSSEIESSSDEEKIGDPKKGYLTSLTVSKGVLKPEFSYDIYDYTVDVDYDVDYLEIEGKTANVSDQIWYTGNEDLIVGKNVRTVKVTDKQGYNHIYTITINRAEGENSSNDEQIVMGSVDSDSQGENISNSAGDSPIIIDSEKDSALDKNKGIITTGLIIVLVTLIIALVVIIVWLKKKKSNK